MMMSFEVRILRPDAVVPKRAYESDAGFDISVTHLINTVDDVSFYGTGISVRPPPGYYFLLFPRSSISKSPYILANGVGVIDNTYRGEIIVALRKVNRDDAMSSNGEDMTFPYRVAQLVPMMQYPMGCTVVDEFGKEDDANSRGVGGFGSSGGAFGSMAS